MMAGRLGSFRDGGPGGLGSRPAVAFPASIIPDRTSRTPTASTAGSRGVPSANDDVWFLGWLCSRWRGSERGSRGWFRGARGRAAAGYLGFALLIYGPLMLMHPGRVAADTKSYLYLDPGRVLDRVGTLWDPNIGLGTVSHQSIGYLFPLGPFYWVMEHVLGAPDWVAQRIWLGTLLFGAGLGMRYLLRTFDVVARGCRSRSSRSR